MPRLSVISGSEAVRAFERLGYVRDRQKGSHIRLKHPDAEHSGITIPLHNELKRGTLAAIIRDSGFPAEEFIASL